jgi:hypothetical protein
VPVNFQKLRAYNLGVKYLRLLMSLKVVATPAGPK